MLTHYSLKYAMLLVCLSFNSFSFTENNIDNFCSLDCNGQINLSLPETGVAVVTPSMMTSGSNCPGILEVHIMDLNGVDIGNEVNCNFVGQTLMVSIVHPATGNSCWGNILVEDKLKPTINCVDIIVGCNDDTSPVNTGIPDVSDNCSVAGTPTYVDIMENFDCADPQFKAVIKRTWTITDFYGNSNSCEQQIFIEKLDINQVFFPPAAVVDCNNPDIDPSNTGEPMVNGIPIGSSCNLMYVPIDGNPIPACGDGYKFIRQWLVVEWCSNEVITGNQTIEVTDITPPFITCPADLTVSTSSNNCDGNIILPTPTVTDDCSNFTVSVDFNFPLSGDIYLNVPAGIHPVTYTATDDCGNSSSCTFNVMVKDLLAPIAVCDNITQVAIGSDGTAKVYATTFNDGSTDNCGIDTFLVKKIDDTDFSECISFDCNEVGDTIMVVLRVVDECGNYNECQVEAIVEDLLPPTITCPNNLVVECTEVDTLTLDTPTIIDNCGLDTMYFVDDSSGFNTCSMTGIISREWFAIDLGGLIDSCTQTVTVVDNAVLIFTFPENDTLSCTETYDPNISGQPSVVGIGCGDIVPAIIDSIRVIADACEESLLIKWGFYDNCADSFLVDTSTQIISFFDLDAPILTCPDTIKGTGIIDNCLEFLTFRIMAIDGCSGIDTVINDYTPSIAMPGDSIAGGFPIGETTVSFTASDFCQNESTCETVVVVEDDSGSGISCPTITFQIPPFFGSVNIDINNYIQDFTTNNCSTPAALVIDESTLDFGLTVHCSDFFGHFYNDLVTIDVIDTDGNVQTCTTTLGYVCFSDLALAGALETEEDEVIEDVIVKIMSDSDSLMNYTNGFYLSDSLASGNDYTIIPEKNINPLNGVTTFDLVLISKHILGVDLLDSPYKIIAADANRSGSLTALDLALIRSLILHSIDELPNNTSWRFVDAHYEFDNELQPLLENFPESMECLNLTENELGIDFIGIKVGDVNGTAAPSNFVTIDTRGDESPITFYTNDILLEKNMDNRVPIFAKDLHDISGFQFTLNFDPSQIEFLEIENGVLKKENFGFRYKEDGAITCSWVQKSENDWTEEGPLFHLNFKAKNNTFLQNIFWLNSKHTNAEAYNIKSKIHGIDLLFKKNGLDLFTNSDEVILFQNQPNPFSTSTEIEFYLPQPTRLEIQILDISGKVIHSYHTQHSSGIHQINLNRNIFPSPGVYLYKLITPSFSASKKMILMN